MKTRFPPVTEADEDGLLAVGGSLEVDWLLDAYTHGIFPWPQQGLPMLWFCPQERGVLDFSRLHWSQSFKKFQKKTDLKITFNKMFEQVIHECAFIKRPGQVGTWITDEMKVAYGEFHRAGYAHSVEVWKEEKIVGGLYGVFVKGVFSAESMFFHQSNASKLALFHLVEALKKNGIEWVDLQMVTPTTEALGAHYISQDQYIERMHQSQKRFSNVKRLF